MGMLQGIMGGSGDGGGNGGTVTFSSFSAWPTTAARSDFTGAVGFSFLVSGSVSLNQLGRLYVVGNVQDHVIKLWDAAGETLLASGTILAASASDGNGFKWVDVTPVTLLVSHEYRISIDETNGGDVWKDEWAPSFDAAIITVNPCYVATPGAYPSTKNDSLGNVFDTPAFRFVS